jgi:TfoX/Sxy family transcriptional regulator of competence genes
MAADPKIANQVREFLVARNDVTARNMFGGTAFMVSGNMLCAVGSDHLMVRVGQAAHESALRRKHAHEMRFTGRSMAGYVTVDPPGYRSPQALHTWLRMALDFVGTLPPK